MEAFEHRPIGDDYLYGRQHVYFTCHPEDFDLYFDEISKIVFKKFDCTIWYYRDNPDDEKEYALRISEMKLFIIPITKKFLTEECRARNFDLPFAIQHNIPVLPLMQTPGLDESFEKICGALHYIDKNACDATTLTYEQKIHKFLSMVLIDDELTQKIKKAFYTHIFLSYRKKDRVFANKLMRLIHDIPFCRDIAIWFDEYLIPGENFNDAIVKAMQKSKLFVLCVTENLVEEGNYVHRVEYPEAVKRELPIMPIISKEMTPEQMELFKEKYKGVPELVNSDDSERLSNRFDDYKNTALTDKDDDPMHLFFIGLAYLNGIEVEIDHRRATDLITRSADLGYWPAMEKLAIMYKIGDGVDRNLEKSLEMYENMINAISEKDDSKTLLEAHCDLLRLFLDSERFRYRHMECVKRHTMSAMKIASRQELSDFEIFKLYSLLAFVNENDEDVSDFFINKAREILPKLKEDDDHRLVEEVVFYSKVAALYYRRNAGMIVYELSSNSKSHEQRRKEGEQFIGKAICLLQKLYEKNPIKWKLNYADALYIFCSMNYSEPFCDDQLLVDSMEQAIRIYQELCEDSTVLYAAKLAELCRNSGNYLAYDIDVVWETVLGIRLNLNSEDYVSGMPEQQIPLNPTKKDDDSDAYDFRRIRKALSLMRYSASIYEEYVDKGQDDCWNDLAQTYFCLSRLLYCVSRWITVLQENNIKEIRVRLLRDACDSYRKMLVAIQKDALSTPAKHHDLEYKKYDQCNQSDVANGQVSETELVELERKIYETNIFSECYDFALYLGNNGLTDEAMQLHEALYHFFKKVYISENFVLELMNLYDYACGKTDVDDTLSLLLEICNEEYSLCQDNDILFDYYYKIARCYIEKGNSVAADGYFSKAKNARSFFKPYQHARFNKLWAMSKKGAGDLVGSEKLLWEGFECLMSMEDMPADLWNDLSHEYTSLLIQMGREKEADAWLNEMLVD